MPICSCCGQEMPDRLTQAEKESIAFAIEALEMDVKRMEAECSTLRNAIAIMQQRALAEDEK